MYGLKDMLKIFICVIAGNTVGSTIYLTLFGRDYQLSYLFLWQVIGIAAVCALGNLIFWANKDLSKTQIRIRFLIHYIYINIVVVGGAFLCEWIKPSQTKGILVMFLLVAIVYVCVTTFMIKTDEQTAEELNRKLRKFNKNEDI